MEHRTIGNTKPSRDRDERASPSPKHLGESQYGVPVDMLRVGAGEVENAASGNVTNKGREVTVDKECFCGTQMHWHHAVSK